jgi:integrase
MSNLTALEVKNAKPGEHTDGNGLILVVRPSRSGGKLRRSWVLRLVVNGRRRKLGLGVYPSVELAHARQKAQDARRALAEGIDPSVTAKRRAGLVEAARGLTLGKAIDDYLAKVAPAYKNAKSDEIRTRALRVHFAPLHSRDVASIGAADVASILRTLKPQTAVKSHAAVRAVFEFAATVLEPHGVIITNPADPRRLRALGWTSKSTRASTPHPALDWRQMPEFIAELARHDDVDARCLAFNILTVARSGAARLAKWDDIDPKRRTWSVPIQDLKDSKYRTAPCVVPLSTAAIDLINSLPEHGAFLFPNAAGRPIDDQAIVHAIRQMHRCGDWKDPKTGKPVTAHGFRATFRTWAKSKRLDREIAELVLGHVFYSSSESPYARDDDAVLALRRDMLDLWGRHCTGQSGELIAFPSARVTRSDEDALAAIRAERAFARLPQADRDRVLAGLFETQRNIASIRRLDRYGDRVVRRRNRNAMKAHLAPILRVLDDGVAGADALDWLTDHHRGNVSAAISELQGFEATARRLLAGARAFEPDVGRKGRGERQLGVELTRQAFFELIELLESVSVRVGATSGKGGPGSRLLARLITCAVGLEVGVETVKDLVQERRRRK